jgi:hypothetical protein
MNRREACLPSNMAVDTDVLAARCRVPMARRSLLR